MEALHADGGSTAWRWHHRRPAKHPARSRRIRRRGRLNPVHRPDARRSAAAALLAVTRSRPLGPLLPTIRATGPGYAGPSGADSAEPNRATWNASAAGWQSALPRRQQQHRRYRDNVSKTVAIRNLRLRSSVSSPSSSRALTPSGAQIRTQVSPVRTTRPRRSHALKPATYVGSIPRALHCWAISSVFVTL